MTTSPELLLVYGTEYVTVGDAAGHRKGRNISRKRPSYTLWEQDVDSDSSAWVQGVAHVNPTTFLRIARSQDLISQGVYL